jgi:hypothetical protein
VAGSDMACVTCTPNQWREELEVGEDADGWGPRVSETVLNSKFKYFAQKEIVPQVQKLFKNTFWNIMNTMQVEYHENQFWFGRNLNLKSANFEIGTNF